jgi:4-alpha-glucanotransferase
MTVLQFGFDGNPDNPHLVHRHQPEDLVYTGTHDNDTTLGWYRSLDDRTRNYVDQYLNTDGHNMPWPAIATVMRSVSWLAVVPVQDFLGLGSEARFNKPGTVNGNWIWQLDLTLCTTELAENIRKRVAETERLPKLPIKN